MSKFHDYCCPRCYWANGDGTDPTDHCEDGMASQKDEYPKANIRCTGYERKKDDPK